MNPIPMNIFQTWKNYDFTPNMRKTIEKLKADHPDFNYYYYTDRDCQKFMETYYSGDVLEAYNTLDTTSGINAIYGECVFFTNMEEFMLIFLLVL